MAEMRIDGIEEVIEQFEEMAKATHLKRAVQKSCALVERDAKRKVRKGKGDLRRSIKSKVDDNGDIVGTIFTTLFYAPYVEYGTGINAENGGGRKDVPWVYCDDEGEWHSTRGQHPQPFLRPALNENREEIKRILREGMK